MPASAASLLLTALAALVPAATAPAEPSRTASPAVAIRAADACDWLHLTAHSGVLDDYGGGPGRIAIHGRGGSSLLDPLGSAASHGCVRVDDAAIRFLARVLAPGVPVASSS